MTCGTGDDRSTFADHVQVTFLSRFRQILLGVETHVDYRAHPELYRVERGEQGVLICQPYKDELAPLWRFKTPDEAKKSNDAIEAKFRDCRDAGDLVGADLARKFLQMGYTRARRYANYRGGRKYAGDDHHELPRGTGEPHKARSAEIFSCEVEGGRGERGLCHLEEGLEGEAWLKTALPDAI